MESPRFENQSDCEEYINWADEEISKLKKRIEELETTIFLMENDRII
jgi:predicted nuclease with TOPRIM domain